MKKIKIVLLSLGMISFIACSSSDDSKDEDKTCVTCAAYEHQGQAIPAVEVCKGENGNAFVLNIDTTIEYNAYLTLQSTLTTCQ